MFPHCSQCLHIVIYGSTCSQCSQIVIYIRLHIVHVHTFLSPPFVWRPSLDIKERFTIWLDLACTGWNCLLELRSLVEDFSASCCVYVWLCNYGLGGVFTLDVRLRLILQTKVEMQDQRFKKRALVAKSQIFAEARPRSLTIYPVIPTSPFKFKTANMLQENVHDNVFFQVTSCLERRELPAQTETLGQSQTSCRNAPSTWPGSSWFEFSSCCRNRKDCPKARQLKSVLTE